MSGQKTYKEKMKIVESFINTVNTYEKQPTLKFDMRGYAEYVEKHKLSGRNIPVEVIYMFNK